VLRLHIGEGDLTAFPNSLDAVQALNLINSKWPAGTTLSLDVVVTHADQPATQDALKSLDPAILAIPGVSGPAKSYRSTDGTVSLLSYTLGGTQNDLANQAIVQRVRHEIGRSLFGPVAANGVEVLVAGDPAYTLDLVNFYLGGMPLVFAFVLGLSFLLLLVAFRSVVIPIKAILLNLLSTGAAYGVMVLVFQEGWFADALSVKPGIIEAFVPVIIFTILFGLSMDYHVFILTRVKEARDGGMVSDEAVARGISITSGTVTSAAAIMVAVFAVFVTLQLYVIKQIGLGLAVAVFLDATIVRSVLLPATMRLLGDWNWWLPPFLRWLPHVTIEGESDPRNLPVPTLQSS
jgi:RND superfamily putative drug exporter